MEGRRPTNNVEVANRHGRSVSLLRLHGGSRFLYPCVSAPSSMTCRARSTTCAATTKPLQSIMDTVEMPDRARRKT